MNRNWERFEGQQYGSTARQAPRWIGRSARVIIARFGLLTHSAKGHILGTSESSKCYLDNLGLFVLVGRRY